MSLELPILTSEYEMITSLGSEFKNYQETQRDRGLLYPDIRDKDIDRENIITRQYYGITPNKKDLFGNNYDPAEDENITVDESMDYIVKTIEGSKNISKLKLMAETNEDVNLDPRLILKLKMESLDNPNDIYDEFGQKATDFVNLVRLSNKEYLYENNLFAQPQDILKDTLSQLGFSGNSKETFGDSIMNLINALSDGSTKPPEQPAQQPEQQAPRGIPRGTNLPRDNTTTNLPDTSNVSSASNTPKTSRPQSSAGSGPQYTNWKKVKPQREDSDFFKPDTGERLAKFWQTMNDIGETIFSGPTETLTRKGKKGKKYKTS